MARIESPQHPLLAERPEERILVLVLAGERGLAGAFNSNILKDAIKFIKSKQGKKIIVIPVGKKARDAFRKAGVEFAGEYVNVLARVDFGVAREIASLVSSLYAEDKVDAVYAVFSEFKSVMSPTSSPKSFFRLKELQRMKRARKKPPRPKQITFTSSRKSRYLTACCPATWKHKFFARCWNRPQPNTPRG